MKNCILTIITVSVTLFAFFAEGQKLNLRSNSINADCLYDASQLKAIQECVNSASTYWPECNLDQQKVVTGPPGYEFGHYCSEEWVNSLYDVLKDPQVNICQDKTKMEYFLAQVAYETGYYSTVYQPIDGGAGLIHMIPANWEENAKDMDSIWPNNNYIDLVK